MSKFDYVPKDGKDILDQADTHDQLVLEFLKYFKEIEMYSRHRSYRPQNKARKALLNMSVLIKERRREITRDYHANRDDRRESGRPAGGGT
jgi:hypothetical protein